MITVNQWNAGKRRLSAGKRAAYALLLAAVSDIVLATMVFAWTQITSIGMLSGPFHASPLSEFIFGAQRCALPALVYGASMSRILGNFSYRTIEIHLRSVAISAILWILVSGLLIAGMRETFSPTMILATLIGVLPFCVVNSLIGASVTSLIQKRL
ncbi:hypothetical protein CCAX7_12790 [Capsulimonas corticalis]|uniref:Uncharacterized protein n=1 Tax=Capsulimonas corticalis TaxID=2219043 RepID=A0A402D459_9BACT|nr:hypothetical protein [Capsulimonas corticalis]BDI29228.1 hypothetical protein CCAX7_12790 [Capsulimonas corticalis]